jgi:hypothetical protein
LGSRTALRIAWWAKVWNAYWASAIAIVAGAIFLLVLYLKLLHGLRVALRVEPERGKTVNETRVPISLEGHRTPRANVAFHKSFF